MYSFAPPVHINTANLNTAKRSFWKTTAEVERSEYTCLEWRIGVPLRWHRGKCMLETPKTKTNMAGEMATTMMMMIVMQMLSMYSVLLQLQMNVIMLRYYVYCTPGITTMEEASVVLVKSY